MNSDLQPVIVGVGQHTWRERDASRTPIDALQAVATQAASDSGSARVMSAINGIVHVPFVANQVPELANAMPQNAGALLAERLGLKTAQYTADVGGNLPQQLVNEFARRTQSEPDSVFLICGAELLGTFLGELRDGRPFPDWGGEGDVVASQLIETPALSAPTELAHGLFEPTNVYPLFESAIRHADDLTKEQQQRRLGSLISAMSEVAADNERAWKQRRYSAEEVLNTDGGNRMICTPYTKLMNAIIAVDQAAAVILTTAGMARKLGVAPERCIYVRGGATAHDPWFVSERHSFSDSPALRAATIATLEQSGVGLEELTHFDLYSCFPSAVQIAAQSLGLALDDPRGMTVTGGLTLFGGPGNNYSLHAIAQMVDCLRETGEGAGLVYANGGYLTKHSLGIYSTQSSDRAWAKVDEQQLQRKLDERGHPTLVEEGAGDFTIEAHTVTYKRGEPAHGIVIGRLASGGRCVAHVAPGEGRDQLIDEDCVGVTGRVVHRDGLNQLSM